MVIGIPEKGKTPFSLKQLIDLPAKQMIEVTIPKRMVWTASSIKLFRRCKRKFFWKYLARLTPRYTSRHLLFGSAFHECVGKWYARRRADMPRVCERYQTRLEEAANAQPGEAALDQEDMDKLQIQAQTFSGMMIAYSQLYERDRLKWKIIPSSVEAEFKINLGSFDYAGKIDLIRAGKKGKTLVEHKTASSIGESYIDRLPLDTQIRGYILGAQEGLQIPVNRVLYNVVKKSKLRRKSSETADEFADRVCEAYASQPEKHFYREDLYFSQDDIEALKVELKQTHKEFEMLTAPFNDALLRVNPRSWTPTDTACNDFFRTCEYHQLCVGGLNLQTKLMYDQRDTLHQELEHADE